MKRLWVVIGIWGCISLGAVSYFSPTQFASNAYEVGVGVKGFGSNASQVFENPAGLYRISPMSVAGFYTNVYGDFNYQNIALGYRVGSTTVSVGVMQLFVPNIPTTMWGINYDYNEDEIMRSGAYDYMNSVYRVGIHRTVLPFLEVGLSGSYYTTSIYTTEGAGFNLDFGAIVHTASSELSFVAENIIPNTYVHYSSPSGREALLQQVRVGGTHAFGPINVFAQLTLISEQDEMAYLKNMGCSYSPSFFKQFLQLNASITEEMILSDSTSSVNLGLTLRLFGAQFDYAYRKGEFELNKNMHFFSFSMELIRSKS